MRVVVTGGTGYLGAHAATRALIAHGHEVRLLVRDPRRLSEVLSPLGIDPPDHVVGDLTDRGAVEAVVDGAEAVLHCGGVVSLARRDAEVVLATNPAAARNVIDAAVDAGLDPIIHVSSVSALFTPGTGPVRADQPIARSISAYGRSKAMAEEHARRRQAEGAPVVITYPSGVTGPTAGPVVGAVNKSIGAILRVGAVPLADAKISYVDVRDVAELHHRLLVADQGPRRVVCGGQLLDAKGLAAVLRNLTGRRLPVLPIPGAVWRTIGRGVDLAARFLPFDPVFTHEAMVLSTRWAGSDDTVARNELGMVYRDVQETFEAAISGLLSTGNLNAGAAGRFAATANRP